MRRTSAFVLLLALPLAACTGGGDDGGKADPTDRATESTSRSAHPHVDSLRSVQLSPYPEAAPVAAEPAPCPTKLKASTQTPRYSLVGRAGKHLFATRGHGTTRRLVRTDIDGTHEQVVLTGDAEVMATYEGDVILSGSRGVMEGEGSFHFFAARITPEGEVVWAYPMNASPKNGWQMLEADGRRLGFDGVPVTIGKEPARNVRYQGRSWDAQDISPDYVLRHDYRNEDGYLLTDREGRAVRHFPGRTVNPPTRALCGDVLYTIDGDTLTASRVSGDSVSTLTTITLPHTEFSSMSVVSGSLVLQPYGGRQMVVWDEGH